MVVRRSGRAVLLALMMISLVMIRANAQANPQDAQIQADVAKALDNKKFKDVKVAVRDGVVALTGTVDLYAEKEDADQKAHHRKNVKAVQNQIEVGGPTVDDVTLRD